MSYRVKKHPSYQGLPICTIEQFISRFLHDAHFLWLHKQWLQSAEKAKKNKKRYFPQKSLRPVPDRMEPWLGYDIENIRFLTYAENHARPQHRKTLEDVDDETPQPKEEDQDAYAGSEHW